MIQNYGRLKSIIPLKNKKTKKIKNTQKDKEKNIPNNKNFVSFLRFQLR